jgi:hypothetical protein
MRSTTQCSTWRQSPARRCVAPVALVHTRLSIIDPRPIADQPMRNDDGSIWIAYNGEVYGWQADARELEKSDVRFNTWCDTEFILRGYEAWGIEALLPRLRGMFAFAIVDFRTKRVHVVRDRMGLKPVVYAHGENGFAFGSLVRSVLPWLPRGRARFVRRGDRRVLSRIATFRAPRTIFGHIHRLPNAHRLELDLATNALRVHRYWAPQPVPVGNYRALLDEAIELRLVADPPLGLFLSGGIDSGTIACRLAATGHRQLRSFSAAFPGVLARRKRRGGGDGRRLGTSERAHRRADDDPRRFRRDHRNTRRAFRRSVVVSDLVPRARNRASREGRAGRRWRRRAVRGVQARCQARAQRLARHDARSAAHPSGPSPERAGARRWPSSRSTGSRPTRCAFQGSRRTRGVTCNPLPDAPVHYWRAPDFDASSRIDRLMRWDFAQLPSRVRAAQGRSRDHGARPRACARRCSITASSRRCSRCRPHDRYTKPPKLFLARLAPTLVEQGAFSARSADSIRRCTAG